MTPTLVAGTAVFFGNLIMPCASNDTINKGLLTASGEVIVGTAITERDEPLVIFANPQTKTFTIAVRKASGVTCLIASGSDYGLKGAGL